LAIATFIDFKRITNMDKVAVIDTWTEYEFGQRPDGVSIHLTREDYEKYVKEHMKDRDPSGPTPEYYTNPNKNLKVVHISDDFYEEVKSSDGGLRLVGSIQSLIDKGKVELI